MARPSIQEFVVGENGLKPLIHAERYQEALELILNAGDQYPELNRMLTFERIFLHAKLNDTAEALRLLEEALSAGIYFPAIVLGPEGDKDSFRTFGALSGLPEFERLKAAHQERYWEAMENAPPVLVTVTPEAPAAAAPPLLFATHGNVSNVEAEIDYYRPVAEWGWVLAMPQSSQPWDVEGHYVWGDWEVTERQLEKYAATLGQRVDYDRARIVTAGISKGGEVAVWLALSGTVPACGFIAIAPGGPRIDEPERLSPLVEASREKGLRGYLIVGDQDTYCYEPTLKLAAFLKEHDITHELEVHPGAGHWFPPDFEQSLRRALRFIVT
jgi:predicted esterase